MNAKQTKIVVGIIWIGLLFVGGTNVMNYAVKITTLADISAGTPFQKGMSFTVWANSSFNTTQARQELAEIRSIGVDWVAINHWYYQDYLNSTVIKRGSLSSDSFANMTSCFQYARSIGLHVLYKPMLNLAKTYDWRSYIIYTPDWMGNYTAWMVENAKAAEAGGVEILSIGCEMGNMQVHSDGVRSMIAAIRAVFSGKLTYSANHDSYTFIDWYDAIDIIGISMYTMMSITWNPTILDLKTVWDGIYYELEELALKWNRPVEFTEIGIQARDGSSMIPNDNQLSLVRDVDEMANYYLSLFQSKIWTAPWFKGAHWWIWDDQDPEINPNLDSFNPILLKDLIQAEYTKEHVVEPPTLRLLTMVAPLVSICVVLVLLVWRAGGVLPGDAVGFGKKQKLARNAMLAVNTGGEGNRNDISFGILAGCVIANITTSLTINVYGVIYKSFSYSIILGLSTTETLITFGGLLLAGIVAGLILLRWFPRHALLVAFCLLLFYPFLSIGNPIQTIFVKTLFDLLVLFLLVGAL
nr:hypothetical protein [Candidatus Sigynarchaeota archaeon]